MLGLALLLLRPADAPANDYGLFIEVETEEDLLDLLAAQEIDQDEYDSLVELLADGVDLNTADRDELYALPNLTYADVDAILGYRDEAGNIDDPLSLVTAEVLSARKLEAVASFLIIRDSDPALYATRGRFRYMTTSVAGDTDVPSMWLSGKVSTFRNLDVGLVGVLTRNRLSDVAYDPNRDALSAREPSVQVHVPKFYLQWETKSWHLVAGTYRIGFGQRLTFDNTTWYAPNGIKLDETINYSQDMTNACKESNSDELDSQCRDAEGNVYQSPDYKWTDRLRGIAAGLKHLEIGEGWLQAFGFFSYQTRSIYQYEIYDRGRCKDPLDNEDEACDAPWVFLRQNDLLEPTSRFKQHTLPDMFNELLGGGNVSYFFDRRTHLGVTGYGADISWLVQGLDLDFQEWSRLPYGGPFGAVGLDVAWGRDRLDLFLEAARSFDGQPAGGGWAVILRSTVTWKKHEFEAVMRYYDKNFANPYSRPLSAADEHDGLRARDEAGMRLRYTGHVGDLQLRATNDFWAQLSDEAPKLKFKVRADYEVERWFIPGLWYEFQDRDLSDGGHNEFCFESPFEEVEGEPVPCSGEKHQAGVQLKFLPLRDLSITAKYQHSWMDERWMKDTDENDPDSERRDVYSDSFRQNMAAWLVVIYKPVPQLRLRARARYLFDALLYNEHLEQSLWFYLEAAYWYERDFRIKLRYEIFSWLDDRESTAERDPNPAHWLRLELEYRF